MENGNRIHWMSWKNMEKQKNRGGMGFHDLTCFNQALLAKQVWRLLKNPNTLTGQILQAKYYSGGNILEAWVSKTASYAWKSISGSRALIREGLIWQIGNGEQVKIWGDKWVPTSATFSIQSSPKILHEQAIVNELIDRDTHWWNVKLLEDIFNEEEV